MTAIAAAAAAAAALFGLSWFALAVFMNAVAQPRPGYQPMRGSDDIPPPPQTGSGVKDAHAPEPAVIARALAIYRLACAVETMSVSDKAAANAIASLTDRVAALEAANARREREAAPRPFSAD